MNFERDIGDYDYIFKNRIDLTLTKNIFIEKKKLNYNSFKQCYFVDYAPYVFKKLRELYTIEK